MSWREQAHMAVFENRNQNHAGDETADVRAPGNAALSAFGECRVDELQHEPEAEHEHGRQVNQAREYPERKQHQHVRARE